MLPPQLFIGQNDEQREVDDPSDVAEKQPYTYSPATSYSRVVSAGTSFNGGTNVFLDFAVPLADIYAANNSSTDSPADDNRLDAALTSSDPLRFFFGTSNQGHTITESGADLMATTLSAGFSAPIALDGSAPTITGTIAFKNSGYSADVTTYVIGGTIYIDLNSSSMNKNSTAAEKVNVTIQGNGRNDKESVELTETGNGTGIFQGWISSADAVATTYGLIDTPWRNPQ